MVSVYLDNAATTPLVDEVRNAMQDWDRSQFGNPSSQHRIGQAARVKVEEARNTIAEFVGCAPRNLFFTSGGTEANNWIVKSSALLQKNRGNHLIVSSIEHPSVKNSAKFLEQLGFEITFLKPEPSGIISPEAVKNALRPETILVSVMVVNNETGVINPVAEIGAICQEAEVPFHCDAVQALGKMNFTVEEFNADFVTFSAHKIHGPKGIGAVFIRNPAMMEPFLHGGAQEANLRAGTENVTAIVGFEAAVHFVKKQLKRIDEVRKLQNEFEKTLGQNFLQLQIIGKEAKRSPFISQIAFTGKSNQSLIVQLDLAGIAVSVGSACSSGSLTPSSVLQAMNLPDEVVNSAVRFSFSYLTTREDIAVTIKALQTILRN